MRNKEGLVIGLAVMLAVIVAIVIWVSPIGENHSSVKAPVNATEPAEQVTEPEPDEQHSSSLSFSSVEEAKAYVKAYAKQKGYSLKDYPEKLFELMVKDSSAIDYALDYPDEINKPHSFILEIGEDDKIPLFIQWDKRWGYHQFRNGVVGLDGCGATCVSMCAVYLKKDATLTPDAVADFVAENGYFINGSGTSWSLLDKGVEHFGLKSKTISTSEKELLKAVEAGNPVIASVRKGDFTKKGHYIVIAGYDDEGFIINDPFSVVNSEKRWQWSRIEPQIKCLWEIYL